MLNRVPIHRSVIRQTLFMGGDREIILMSLVISVALIFILQSMISTIFGICLWLFSLWTTRIMVKADPKMRDIYLQYIRYARFYSAKSTPFFEEK